MNSAIARLALPPEPDPGAAVRRAGAGAALALGGDAIARHRHHLVGVVERRDTASFIALFNDFAPRVKAYMKRLGVPDDEAEELTQEVMAIVWHRSASYDPAKSAVSSWIFAIARNLRIDAVRRDRRRAFDLDDPLLMPPEPEWPDERLDLRDRQRRVRAALALLPPDQEMVVKLAFFEGLSHIQIAAALTVPLGTVKSRMRLAFQRLRAALEDEGDAAASAATEPRREAA